MIIKITKITSLFLSIFAICILNISCISLVRGSEEEAVGKYNILNDYEIEILYRAPTIKFEFIIDFEHYENFSVFADGKQIITDTTEIDNNVKKLIVKTEHKLQIEKITFDSSDNKFYFYSEIPAKDLSDFGILKTCGVNEFDYKKFLLGDVTSSIVGFDMFENSFTGSILAYGIIDNNIKGFYSSIIKFETDLKAKVYFNSEDGKKYSILFNKLRNDLLEGEIYQNITNFENLTYNFNDKSFEIILGSNVKRDYWDLKKQAEENWKYKLHYGAGTYEDLEAITLWNLVAATATFKPIVYANVYERLYILNTHFNYMKSESPEKVYGLSINVPIEIAEKIENNKNAKLYMVYKPNGNQRDIKSNYYLYHYKTSDNYVSEKIEEQRSCIDVNILRYEIKDENGNIIYTLDVESNNKILEK